MGYLIGALIVIAIAVFVIYLCVWLSTAAVMLLIAPALLIVLPVCALCGVLFAFAVALLTLLGSGSWRPPTITPDNVVNGTARLPKPRGDNPFGRDRAWPSYLVAQWRIDLVTAWKGASRILGAGWSRINNFAGELPWPPLWLPVLVFPYLIWLAVSVGALASGIVLVLAGGVTLLLAWSGWSLVIGLLRAVDLVVRRSRKASGSCPVCYHVTLLPGYPCDGCQQVHHDIRPGRLGGVWRRCGCGTVLPTTVLRASRRLTARCPRCDQPLRPGAAVLTDIRLPVFGPVSAGKTRLVNAGLVALRDQAAAVGARLDFVDDESRQAFEDGVKIITSGGDTSKTPAGKLPRAITARLVKSRRRALLHLFDAAGEFYIDREDNSDLEFLDHAQGLVFVVDPFSVRWVRDQLGDAFGSRLVAANPATSDPEQVYHVTARRLRDYGVDTRRRRLAMTVVKADLLVDLPVAAGLRAGQVRDWLIGAGLDNLVLSAERDFAEVRYFVVASVSGAQAALSPANPFNWLMARAGLLLPGEHGEEQQEHAKEPA